ncbi:MAG: hypothetical protein JW883_02220 [Deltaproteobacteria bacterium]|nr:hypothetical protein [Deltaproteobacteria bacterium]
MPTLSGLPKTKSPRNHYDIYTIFEAPQELYFGDEKQVNVNIVEKVRIQSPEGEKEKCYISPTKRRGVERRCLLWSDADGQLLMDKLVCGIPNTCCKESCPVCSVYGGLITGERTFIGRITHSGGVAILPQITIEKQRAMHPAIMGNFREEVSKELLGTINKEQNRKKDANKYKKASDLTEPMPYRKEYAQPGLLYPVSNHCLSISSDEFATVAYAFLMSLNRLGAGNPKGVSFARAAWDGQEDEPLLVVDEYRVPLGERPIVSPSVSDNATAIGTFIKLAKSVSSNSADKFSRSTGNEALKKLQDAAKVFEQKHLQA